MHIRIHPAFRFIAIGILCLHPVNMHATAQRDTSGKTVTSLAVISRGGSDSILLRWGPTSSGAWRRWKVNGCELQRREIVPGVVPKTGDWKKLTDTALKPWPMSSWQGRVDTSSFWLGMALASAFHDRLISSGAMKSATANAALDDEGDMAMSLLAADRDAAAAEALGLRYVDRSVRAGATYEYMVFIARMAECGDTAIERCTASALVTEPAAAMLEVQAGDGKITLTWKQAPASPSALFHVFRSDDNGANDRKMTEAPIICQDPQGGSSPGSAEFTDTTVVNGRRYRYRVLGLTAFADLSAPLEVEAGARDLTPPPAPMPDDPEEREGEAVKITWIMSDAEAGDLAGFRVQRGAEAKGEFKEITSSLLPSGTREFLDKDPSDRQPFYTVSAVDTAGNTATSWPVERILVDSLPPAVPTGLQGSLDSLGLVHLSWKANTDNDFYRYDLRRSFDSSETMAPVTPHFWKDTVYTDSINIFYGTRAVYYEIRAIDARGNMSASAQRIAIPIPDRTPPSRPVFGEVQTRQDEIVLTWMPSPSDDIIRQLLYRSTGDTAKPVLYQEFPPATASFTDTSPAAGVIYTYELFAQDGAGNLSESDAVRAGIDRRVTISPVNNLRAVYDKDSNLVRVSWDAPRSISARFWYVVSRAPEGGQLRRYRLVDSDDAAFTDAELTDAARHSYSIRVVSESGDESSSTAMVVVDTSRK